MFQRINRPTGIASPAASINSTVEPRARTHTTRENSQNSKPEITRTGSNDLEDTVDRRRYLHNLHPRGPSLDSLE
eukprot:6871213-Pyramimonas_sp.AAC.1